MNISLRRTCFVARNKPLLLQLASPSHQLQLHQLRPFISSRLVHKLRRQAPPREYPSEAERKTRQDEETIKLEAIRRLQANSTRRAIGKSILVWAIVAVNAGVLLSWQYGNLPNNVYHHPTTREIYGWMDFMQNNFIQSVDSIDKGRWWTAITAGFSHQRLVHFAFNMVTFVSFSNVLVNGLPQLSPLKVGILCLGSILSASAASYVHQKANGDARGGLGASGMVSGVLTALTCAYPMMGVRILGFIPAKMWMNTLLFFGIDAGIVGSGIWSPIGHDAHLGGSLFGVLFYVLAIRRARLPRRR